eukprot:CAMPEP_0194143506 /NCGR_PEP_ID=MMETSP0152-20130528/12676_1 /TAXON_ID=1049557 /ORGANISM="Thalassiothrix antarctica, Strain L6-D1" /LENGTH=334 /DNA_ID=CAMNT_0038842957 /DNA_START=78 /DNA_END=1082 /DNA_ORIENTATION=+
MESGVGKNIEFKLFIGGLARSVDDDALYAAFQDYGKIPFCKVCMDRETGDSRGFGFVCYSSKDDADAAVEAMNGFTLEGYRLSVKSAEDPSEPKADKTMPTDDSYKTMPTDDSCKLFVRCLAWVTDEASLRTAFEAFGTVVYCRVQTERGSGRSRGFGFVCFGSADEATAALEMDQADLDGRTINVMKAQPKSQSTPFKGGRSKDGGATSARHQHDGEGTDQQHGRSRAAAKPAAAPIVAAVPESPTVAKSATDGDEKARRKEKKKRKKERKEAAAEAPVDDEKAAKKLAKAAKKEAKASKKRKAEESAEEVVDDKAAKKARKAAKKAKKAAIN